jgi:UDP-2,3-diacylglucosamine pyrophosphatase LpxH
MANKIKIDTLIISDTHLGDSSTRCRVLLEVIRKYEFKRLILNGDIVDGLHFQRFNSEHWDILSEFRKLSKQTEVIWIHGNHDAAAKTLSRLLGVKVFNKYIWEEGGKKFLAIHGHQFDRFMHNNMIMSYLAFVSYNFLKKFDKTEYLINTVRNRSKAWKRNSADISRGALRLARMLNCDYVFCGHAHQIFKSENKGIKYFNTGSWVEKPSGYITIVGSKIDLLTV